MAKFDLRAVGITAGVTRHRVAASATDTKVGEPLGVLGASYTSGETDKNTVTQLADNDPVIGTDMFVGICSQDFETDSSGTVIAHYTEAMSFIPQATKVRGKAEASTDIDTQSELTGVLFDVTVFARSGTPAYTIVSNPAADTGALMIMDGNITRGTLDCVVDNRAFRHDVS